MSETPKRTRIVWTETAVRCLEKLPRKVRAGLIAKADELEGCDNPDAVHKPLVGPLAGHHRITYGRYRAIYKVVREELANGDVLYTATVYFIAAGIRKEHSKDDVYRLAEKLVGMGIIDPEANPGKGED